MNTKHCVNCPGATDHSTADCPMVRVPRELLGRALKADASIGANAIQLADGWKAMAELRAMLTAQPQASATQSAPAGEREAFEAYSQSISYTLKVGDSGRYIGGYGAELWAGFKAGASWQRTQSAGVPEGWRLVMAIELAEEKHGSLRAAARALGIDAGYLSRLKKGEKVNPSEEVLAALGLERMTMYRASQPAAHGRVRAALSPENQRVVPVEPLLANPHPLSAAHDQGEVQRLREALEGMLEYFPEGASDGECFAVDAARAALAASTGQEVKS